MLDRLWQTVPLSLLGVEEGTPETLILVILFSIPLNASLNTEILTFKAKHNSQR